MSEEIAKGDMVRLKSGGPKMMVDEIRLDHEGGAHRVCCDWFDQTNWRPQRKEFALTNVERVPPKSADS